MLLEQVLVLFSSITNYWPLLRCHSQLESMGLELQTELRTALPEACIKEIHSGQRKWGITSHGGSHSAHSFTHQIFTANLLYASHCYLCWRSSNEHRKGPGFHEVYILAGETDDRNRKVQKREGYLGSRAANKQGKWWREDPVTWRGVWACALSRGPCKDEGLRVGNSFACSWHVQGDWSEWVRERVQGHGEVRKEGSGFVGHAKELL